MNKRQAQERNSNIMQLRGMLPRIVNIIPDDVLKLLDNNELYEFRKTARKIMDAINKVKVKRFVCINCKFDYETKITKNKKACCCDECGDMADELYLARCSGERIN